GGEVDLPVPDGEDRVVATDLRARPGPEPAAALADQDHPGLDVLPGEDLHAQSLRVRVAPVARGTKTLLVRHLAVLLLVRERRLERGDRALTRAVLQLVLQSGLEHGPPPTGNRLRDLRDRHLGVALRQPCGRLLLARLFLLAGRLFLLGARLLFFGRWLPLIRSRLPGPDRLDFDLRELRPEAGVPAVSLLRTVLADPPLLAEDVADDARGDGRALRRKIRLAVAAE